MKTIIFNIIIFALCGISWAQEYDGLVKITDNENIYNGIVVGDGLILTTSENTPDEVALEFYGANHKFRTYARPIKRDDNLNLCLLKYTKPTPIKGHVKIYKPTLKRFYAVDIEGWNSINTKYLFMDIVAQKNIELSGYGQIEASGFAVLSKGDLVGIQVYKNREIMHIVWAKDIKKFINH